MIPSFVGVSTLYHVVKLYEGIEAKYIEIKVSFLQICMRAYLH